MMMSDTALRYEPSVPMHEDHRGGWVKVRDYERLRAELNEAADATGIAGVDEPMSLLQCIQSLRAEVVLLTQGQIDAAWGQKYFYDGVDGPLIRANLVNIVACEKCGGSGIPTPYEVGSGESCPTCHGHGWIITSQLVDKCGRFGTGDADEK